MGGSKCTEIGLHVVVAGHHPDPLRELISALLFSPSNVLAAGRFALKGRRRKRNANGDREEVTGKQLPEFLPCTRDPRSGLRVRGLPVRAR